MSLPCWYSCQAFLAGVWALSAQLMVFREIALFCQANELILSFSMAFWVGGTAWGAGAWSRRIRRLDQALPLGIPMLPAGLLTLHVVWKWMNPLAGIEPSLGQWLVLMSLSALPTAAFGGCWYALIVRRMFQSASVPSAALSARLFTLEVLGSVAAGLAYTLFLASHWHPVTILLVLIICLSGIAVVEGTLGRWKPRQIIIVSGSVLLALWLVWPYARWLSRPIMPGVVVKTLSFFTPQAWVQAEIRKDSAVATYNGQLWFVLPDENTAVESWLPLYRAAGSLERLGYLGDQPAVIHQAWLTAEVKHLDVFQIDPQAWDRLWPWLPETWHSLQIDPRLKSFPGDARMNLRRHPGGLDAILVQLPLPQTLSLYRYYTNEFLFLLRSRLSEHGAVDLVLPYSPNRLNALEAHVLASLWATWKTVFPNGDLVAGDRLHFLGASRTASRPAPLSILRGLERLQAEGRAEGSWARRFDAERSRKIREELESVPVDPLRDHRPLLVVQQLLFWLSRNAGLETLVLVILAALAAAGWLKRRRTAMALTQGEWVMALSGGCGLAAEWFVIMGYQIRRGDLWQEMGLLFAAYLSGMAVGAMPGPGLRRESELRIALGWLAVLAGVAYPWVLAAPAPEFSAPVLLVLLGFWVSRIYTVLTHHPSESQAVRLWSADVWGASAGALVASTLFLPLLGRLAGLPALILLAATAWWVRREPTAHS